VGVSYGNDQDLFAGLVDDLEGKLVEKKSAEITTENRQSAVGIRLNRKSTAKSIEHGGHGGVGGRQVAELLAPSC
jgi:hypothetical protein